MCHEFSVLIFVNILRKLDLECRISTDTVVDYLFFVTMCTLFIVPVLTGIFLWLDSCLFVCFLKFSIQALDFISVVIFVI